jgi:hypothetical protein
MKMIFIIGVTEASYSVKRRDVNVKLKTILIYGMVLMRKEARFLDSRRGTLQRPLRGPAAWPGA